MTTIAYQTCNLVGLRFWFVSVLPLLLMFSALAHAQFTTTTNKGQITITKYTGSGGNVEIPSMIDGLPVTSIGADNFQTNVFDNCTSLTGVTIPNSVTNIGWDIFNDCKNLNSITASKQNSAYSSVNGVLFNHDQTTLIRYPRGKAGSYTIPDSVTTIDDCAFFKCTRLTSVKIPDHVKIIGPYAFNRCTGLTSVTIPNRVTSIDLYAFYGCKGLTTITFPKSITFIGLQAFAACTRLKSVVFEGNAPRIDMDIFMNVGRDFTVYYSKGATGFTSPTWTDASDGVYAK